MENATCNIVYVDRNVHRDVVVQKADAVNGFNLECQHFSKNLGLLRDVFKDIHLCSTGTECISTLTSLHDSSMVDLKPTLVLIDMPYDEKVPPEPAKSRSRSPSPSSVPPPEERLAGCGDEKMAAESEMYGLRLLERVVSEAQLRNLSRLVVPIPIVRPPLANGYPDSDGQSLAVDAAALARMPNGRRRSAFLPNRKLMKRCLDLGAIDVITSPMTEKTLVSIEVQAYRAHKDAAKEQQAILEVRRGRKRSWVGVNEEKPFAYLREAMVSGLMSGICRVDSDRDSRVMGVQLDVPGERYAKIAAAVGEWQFCAHSLSEDELVVAARVMFRHALSMPELERWRIPTDQLTSFLVACKAAYNSFVPYHNFRHVIDVLQATFHFLVGIGALSPYPPGRGDKSGPAGASRSPMGALIDPAEALTLLITAIGHDVGHPGVNNGFLVTLNAPLAQLYSDRSVLESFHCAAYSQILRRYWPPAFEDTKMRKLMISSILATDMGLHFDYMKKLGDTQEKLQERNTTEGWNGRMIEEQKALVCSLIIKCADISNVARKHDTTLKWMYVLNDEFSRQSSMETELSIPTSLFAPPKKDPVSLYQSQIGFMNIFAIPLFQGVADIMPNLRYTVEELEVNKSLFQDKISFAEPPRRRRWSQEAFSPRTLSLAVNDDVALQINNHVAANNNPFPEDATDSSSGPTTSSFETPRGARTCDDSPDTNGVSTFDSVAQFATSNPFSCHDDHPLASDKQRCSETTEGSSSAPYSGDWASQATSATTGKMPQSPSTQGTSIISKDSLDRPTSSIPVTTVTCPDNKLLTEPQLVESRSVVDDESNASTNGTGTPSPQPRRLVKKKSSIFKMNALNFFRKHKSPSPPVPPLPPPTHLQPHETTS